MRRILPLALLATLLCGGEPALVVTAYGPMHAPGLLRVAVRRDCLPAEAALGPVQLAAELRDGDRLLADTGVSLPNLGQLARGVELVLVPAAARSPAPLRLRVTLVRPQRPGTPPASESVEVAVAAPATILAQATATIARLQERGESDPLPWLWSAQITDLSAGPPSAAGAAEVASLGARLGAWLDGIRPPPPGPGCNLLALRDPADGSAQPFRLHLPPGPGPFAVAMLLLPPAPGLDRAHWPLPPADWLAAAAAANLAVVECYPAGDRGWNGAAARRVPLALAAAARVSALDTAQVKVADRAGADASAPRWWLGLPVRPLDTRPDPGVASVLAAPFTVVVGTAEHAAARTWNRNLADAFCAAYAVHAHALPPRVDDDVEPGLLAGRNLVLIGNPRSNRILAGLAPSLPFTWDHRLVRGPDGFEALRAAAPALACTVVLPDGRTVLILDGAPPPWGDGLPLAGAPLPLALPSR